MPQLKYHYFYRFFTYSVKREAGASLGGAHDSGMKRTAHSVVVRDPF